MSGCGHRAFGRGGFTLIELAVVVAAVGVVIGLLLPALGGSVRIAHRVRCAASLRTLSTALNLYSDSTQQLPVVSLSIGLDLRGATAPRGKPGEHGGMQLVRELAVFLDAPLPRFDEDGRVDAGQPWVCPAERTYDDGYRDRRAYRPDGFSYDYFAASIARPDAFPDSLRYDEHFVPQAQGIGRDALLMYLANPGLVILADSRPFHSAHQDESGTKVAQPGWNHAAFDGSVRYISSR